MLVFALLVIVIFNFAFDVRGEAVALVAPGVLWVTLTFAGVLGFNRAFVLEKDRGCLEGLMLCPIDRGTIYWGKMAASLTFMLVVEAIVLPLFSIFFNLPLFMPSLLLIAFISTVGFAAVGTLFSAIAVHTRAREIMLPLLFFPVVVPVVIAAVEGTGMVLAVAPWASLVPWLQLVVAFDIIFLAVSWLLFEYVLEE